MADKIVVADKIVKEFKPNLFMGEAIRIIDGVSFELDREESLAIIGPNGSGKTTLLKILATIYLPDSGTALIDGYDIIKDTEEVRNRISLVSPALDFQKKLTLKETLKFFADIQDSKIDQAFDFLQYMGLMPMLDLRLETFSEGQKAMTRLAIGLMKKPEILLLDEVFATLDFRRREHLIKYLEDYVKGITLIIVDHHSEVVDRLCTKMLLMKRGGSTLKIGSVGEIFERSPYKYDVIAVPKKYMSEEISEGFGYPYMRLGGRVRFFVKNKEEADDLIERMFEWDKFVSFEVSGVSMDDIYWLSMLESAEEERFKKFCTQCGAFIPRDLNFCLQCGYFLD